MSWTLEIKGCAPFYTHRVKRGEVDAFQNRLVCALPKGWTFQDLGRCADVPFDDIRRFVSSGRASGAVANAIADTLRIDLEEVLTNCGSTLGPADGFIGPFSLKTMSGLLDASLDPRVDPRVLRFTQVVLINQMRWLAEELRKRDEVIAAERWKRRVRKGVARFKRDLAYVHTKHIVAMAGGRS